LDVFQRLIGDDPVDAGDDIAGLTKPAPVEHANVDQVRIGRDAFVAAITIGAGVASGGGSGDVRAVTVAIFVGIQKRQQAAEDAEHGFKQRQVRVAGNNVG